MMKKNTLICLFLVLATLMHAQNPRIETFGDRRMETYKFMRGGDSIRFSIMGKNDTVQKTNFYRSGKISSIEWRNDSSHNFNELGQLTNKYFSKKEKDLTRDSSIFLV